MNREIKSIVLVIWRFPLFPSYCSSIPSAALDKGACSLEWEPGGGGKRRILLFAQITTKYSTREANVIARQKINLQAVLSVLSSFSYQTWIAPTPDFAKWGWG